MRTYQTFKSVLLFAFLAQNVVVGSAVPVRRGVAVVGYGYGEGNVEAGLWAELVPNGDVNAIGIPSSTLPVLETDYAAASADLDLDRSPISHSHRFGLAFSSFSAALERVLGTIETTAMQLRVPNMHVHVPGLPFFLSGTGTMVDRERSGVEIDRDEAVRTRVPSAVDVNADANGVGVDQVVMRRSLYHGSAEQEITGSGSGNSGSETPARRKFARRRRAHP